MSDNKCGILTADNAKACGYHQPLTKKMVWDSETREVHDELGNMIGYGEPIWKCGEIVAMNVTPETTMPSKPTLAEACYCDELMEMCPYCKSQE